WRRRSRFRTTNFSAASNGFHISAGRAACPRRTMGATRAVAMNSVRPCSFVKLSVCGLVSPSATLQIGAHDVSELPRMIVGDIMGEVRAVPYDHVGAID